MMQNLQKMNNDSSKNRVVCIHCGAEYIKIDKTHWMCPNDANIIGISDSNEKDNKFQPINLNPWRDQNDSKNR